MEDLKSFLQPVTELLPERVREFLDAGGWWLVLIAAALLALGILDRLVRRIFRRRPRAGDAETELDEDLSRFPPPPGPPGEHQLMVYHIPARLRLVVMAPAGSERYFPESNARKLLDQLIPGLREVAAVDRPRYRVWPPQLSQQGFVMSFHRHMTRPEPDDGPSQWILVAGKAQVGRQALLVGLVLWTPEPTTIGRLGLEPHQWLDVLRLKS